MQEAVLINNHEAIKVLLKVIPRSLIEAAFYRDYSHSYREPDHYSLQLLRNHLDRLDQESIEKDAAAICIGGNDSQD